MAQDPIQGLIDYVEEIKPFHTKILEVVVAYAHNDDVDVVFTETVEFDVGLFWPDAISSDSDSVPIRICAAGYGVLFDRPTPYIVVDASLSPQTISLDGDHRVAFDEGTRFEIRQPSTEGGSPLLGSPLPPRVYNTLSVDFDSSVNTTILGVTGSPQFSGSPGNEFFFPPYSGDVSGGDVFVIYTVVDTTTLSIITRPSPYYGSPGFYPAGAYRTGSPQPDPQQGSPYTPIWHDFSGSPIPGSPKTVVGSPATYPNFGSPLTNYNTQPTSGNTITIKSTTPGIFLYGQEIEIRNASEPTINRAYNILTAVQIFVGGSPPIAGSPALVELTVLDSVLADTTNDGELVFTPDGFSGGDLCGDVPPEFLQTIWLENLDMTWRFDGTGSPAMQPMTSAFQHFIMTADSVLNTITVQGDVRDINASFGSPLGGSPINVLAVIQHAVTAFGSPFESSNFGSPDQVPLSANNGNVVISNITYDVTINRSTLTLDTVSSSTATGWIISRQ